MTIKTMIRFAFLAVLALFANLSWLSRLEAQDTGISFETDLPRTLIFIAEEGGSGVAAGDLSAFLREAEFPLIDPALAHTAAQRELVNRALEGDEGAATDLGRDFGAQILIIGLADWDARPDPVDGTLITATAEVTVRALRLDYGTVIASAQTDARGIDATEQAARSKVLHAATNEILQETTFVGQLMNNWASQPWADAEYWRPDPGSVTAVAQERTGPAPGLAILLADVRPSTQGGTRGLGVVKKGDRTSSIFNPVRVEGVVVGEAENLQVESAPANLEPLSEEEARLLGLENQKAMRFWAETNLPMSRDTVRIVAQGPS
jgi:hypothetical protein